MLSRGNILKSKCVTTKSLKRGDQLVFEKNRMSSEVLMVHLP